MRAISNSMLHLSAIGFVLLCTAGSTSGCCFAMLLEGNDEHEPEPFTEEPDEPNAPETDTKAVKEPSEPEPSADKNTDKEDAPEPDEHDQLKPGETPGHEDNSPKGSTCVRLGWSGGAADSGYTYVDGQLSQLDNGDRLDIRYAWKDGSMNLKREAPGSLTYVGSWRQEGGSLGGAVLNFTVAYSAAHGSWTSKGDPKRNAMSIEPCTK